MTKSESSPGVLTALQYLVIPVLVVCPGQSTGELGAPRERGESGEAGELGVICGFVVSLGSYFVVVCF